MRSKLTDEQRHVYKPCDLANQLLERMERTLASQVPFSEGAEVLLKQMKEENIPLALVSASSRPLVDAALTSIGETFFAVTISDNDVERSKPDPEGYCKAAELLGVEISSSLVIEDSITGMNAAISSGAYVLGIPHVVDLPNGERVIHHKTLEGLTLEKLASMFALDKYEMM
jgi:HAD superfamily hydrolase (TIGR01509 family)